MAHTSNLVILSRPLPKPPEPIKHASFLGLPAELRMIIYEELLLVLERRIIVSSNLDTSAPDSHLYPAILRVCKTTYEEALPILYSSNMFEVRSFVLRYSGTQRRYMVPSNAALIRRVITLSNEVKLLDQKKLQQQYKEMGIDWEKLHLWAAYILHIPGRKPEISGYEDWLFQPSGVKELEKLGIYKNQRHWMNWVIRKGSTKLSSRLGVRR